MDNPSPAADREHWWRGWFNNLYLDVYAHRGDADADAEAAAALEWLKLDPNARVLDLCCGNGRHCRALLRRGYANVVGVDYSFPLLRHALSEKPRACYLRGNMKLLPLKTASCGAILSFFTSFGYFKTNIENLQVLYEMARVLRPGGAFLLDYLNPDHVRANFQPETRRDHGEYIIHETRSFSADGERIEKEIVIENWGGGRRSYHESVRLYTLEEMREMLVDALFSIEGVLGGFDGRPFDASAPRMILLGRRR